MKRVSGLFLVATTVCSGTGLSMLSGDLSDFYSHDDSYGVVDSDRRMDDCCDIVAEPAIGRELFDTLADGEKNEQEKLALITSSKDALIGLEAEDDRGYTPVFIAAEKGLASVVTFFVAAGANVNRWVGGVSALSLALANTHYDLAAYLIRNGVWLSRPEVHEDCISHAFAGRHDAVKIYLEGGMDVFKKYGGATLREQLVACHWGMPRRNVEIAESVYALEKKGACSTEQGEHISMLTARGTLELAIRLILLRTLLHALDRLYSWNPEEFADALPGALKTSCTITPSHNKKPDDKFYKSLLVVAVLLNNFSLVQKILTRYPGGFAPGYIKDAIDQAAWEKSDQSFKKKMGTFIKTKYALLGKADCLLAEESPIAKKPAGCRRQLSRGQRQRMRG
ncbi:MAG: ankyrin repeat domain-containing protein [Candidatus Dependentiae bacterium]|nr:ankyrin repeat domain-containing protein [Candidatus Dependentiae bacterium]